LSTYSVYTNLPPTGPFRGVGVSHVCWAYESEMDDIARRLGIDPLELRLRHLVKEGDIFVTGEKLVSVGITECLERTARAIGWNGKEEQLAPLAGKNVVRGKGLAVTIKSTTTPTTSSANVRLNADGSAILLTSSVDMGQGALTSLAQIVGDELGLSFEKVSVSFPDTDLTPYDKSSSSSRTTFHMVKRRRRRPARSETSCSKSARRNSKRASRIWNWTMAPCGCAASLINSYPSRRFSRHALVRPSAACSAAIVLRPKAVGSEDRKGQGRRILVLLGLRC